MCPVYVGSAMTGTGVAALMGGLVDLLPIADGDDDEPCSGSIFKIERGDAGEKIAYIRMFAGTVHVRDRLQVHGVAVDYQSVPLYVYRNIDEFASAMEQYVRDALQEGLCGWSVTDCEVTMFSSSYSAADGPPSRRGPTSTAADFRKLTPLVMMQALQCAGARVCEPISRVRIDAPSTSMGSVLSALAQHGAAVHAQTVRGDDVSIEADLPAAAVPELHRTLPALTNGDGVLESTFAGYQPVRGEPPVRRRTTANPLNRPEYLAALSGQAPQLHHAS